MVREGSNRPQAGHRDVQSVRSGVALPARLETDKGRIMVILGRFGRETLCRSFDTEAAAGEKFDELMLPYFHLISEVWLEHYDGSKLRIDRVGVPRRETGVDWAPLMGFELKKNTHGIGDLTRAFNQSMDYRDSFITDKRFNRFRGCVLPFVFVFPDSWEQNLDSGMYGGAIRQAGRRNVGLVRHEHYYGVYRILLHASGQRLWSSDRGSEQDFGDVRHGQGERISMSLNPAGIPQELKDRDQWIVWRAEGNGAKKTKVPYIAALKNGELTYRASSRNPKHWTTFDKALKVFKGTDASGIGFVFSENDPYAVADFDAALEDGAVEEKVAGWLEDLDTYTEISVSGTGFHVVCEADVGAGASVAGYEVYDRYRYIAMTGDVWQGKNTIESRPDEFRKLSELVRERQRRLEGRKSLQRRKDAHRSFEGEGIDIEDFLYDNRVSILRQVGDAGGRKFQILCPWLDQHTGGDESGTYAGQFDDGALWFDCKHSHCRHKKWQEFREATQSENGLAEWSQAFRQRYNISVGSKVLDSAERAPEPEAEPASDAVAEFIEHGRFPIHDAIVNGIDPPKELLADILLAGKAHTIFAPGGAGKTWVLVWLATELVRQGKTVIVFDLENSGRTMSERFEEVGIDPMEAAERLFYFDFPSLHPEVYEGVLEHVNPDIVMFDSWVGFLSAEGLDENAATDIAGWANAYIKPALRRGCATLGLDHVPHDDDDRERGSTRKRDEVDVRWKLSKIGDFNREEMATVNLWLKKDREGWLPRKLGFELGGDPASGRFAMRRNDDLVKIEITHMSANERGALRILEEQGPMRAGKWHEAVLEADVTMSRRTLERVANSLQEKNKVVKNDDVYSVREAPTTPTTSYDMTEVDAEPPGGYVTYDTLKGVSYGDVPPYGMSIRNLTGVRHGARVKA